jgi:hypothetical protein
MTNDSGTSNLPNLEQRLASSRALRDPADPAWAWLPHYRQASRRRRGRNWHRYKEAVPTLRRHRSTKRVLRPILAVAGLLVFLALAAFILQR